MGRIIPYIIMENKKMFETTNQSIFLIESPFLMDFQENKATHHRLNIHITNPGWATTAPRLRHVFTYEAMVI